MGDRFCLTLLEAAEMNGFTAAEMHILVDRHAEIAANANGSYRIDPDALKAVVDGSASYLKAA
ncbi:hypothetical protein [uncultured Nisaea sp.]|jgi:hypothetical protein|uniref:hypothetical protein n=1 Tax=uncultured Nisaea sp. TaxID=538215 RepID=UPI0030EE1F75|tara:strand:+ start:475 stop:663 length:189 start_codon:yes stop_codon:yes gene_type:complete